MWDNVYGAVIMTQVIARVYPVHLTNVDQRQAVADPQTRPSPRPPINIKSKGQRSRSQGQKCKKAIEWPA